MKWKSKKISRFIDQVSSVDDWKSVMPMKKSFCVLEEIYYFDHRSIGHSKSEAIDRHRYFREFCFCPTLVIQSTRALCQQADASIENEKCPYKN
jgi:hypothetical protein